MKDKITLVCMYCKKEKEFDADSLEAQGILNFFCDGECEDRFAATL